ncbi:ROK family protein [Alteromonas marina]|uniref:hydantoinase/oxoprolinase family protein n=1 Tax=unclassified Alteromonas TaxID=2614992 RepID=UPI0012E5B605|nr:hydantoinase/oxoprolinase family protein [Alteromonas sp. KUL150]GFD71233.1 hydantoinase [Tenacibaculum sp. KUL113]GFD87221.1 hydantoinase [Alteromonas sp. KUL150]
MRIGIDVGGTHTDAVLLDNETILATNKSLTTADVASGIIDSLNALLNKASVSANNINAVMIGTTQFTNAIVERRQLSNIAVIRLALPSGKGCPPMIEWPEDLVNVINPSIYECHGGYLYDGYPVADINIQEIEAVIADIKQKEIKSVAIASAFSTMNAEPELLVANLIRTVIPDCEITLSHQIGSIGLLERENAAILNATLRPFAQSVVNAFENALTKHAFNCPFFISQNDGTLMNADFVRAYPALTFASGPTNSLRGAYKLTGKENAIVVDIGGTTSDIGVLQNGFPRESNRIIKVGGVRTNFRMPDINAVGLGGGSIVRDEGKRIGPDSCGHKLVDEALIFNGNTLTTTDIIVASGHADIGDSEKVKHVSSDVIQSAITTMRDTLNYHIEMMKPDDKPVPVILVGGGAVLIQGDLPAASDVIRPVNAGVANAIGAAIAQIGGEAESMLSYRAMSRDDAIKGVTQLAIDKAVTAGADKTTVRTIDIEEIEVPYMEGDMRRVRVKVVGDIATVKPSAKTSERQTGAY